ncbi:hypothetical protein DOY81_011266 [Sarcophaga bullata]|nr:hypothetical protein DOY81_011266 [Sarcophaga bullata]
MSAERGAIASHCIRSGDGRSGEQPGLLALHHVWVHEHNHIATKLGEMNLHWSDEKIYQETRRIIGAMFQHITYREFLPIVLGREVVKLFDLETKCVTMEGYDPISFPFGLDLAAINIQRGRDHGIPPYTHWRVPCGLTPINTWQEFANVVGPESARRISHAYHSVHDIDLFVGGIAERPVVGGLVGPTFACIIAQQFSNSRKGDRFWYENAGFESSFTPAQLHAIRRVSFASVLCRVVGGGTFQPHIFLPPELPDNKRVPCGVAPLADFDISPWLEQDPFASLSVVQHIRTSTRPPQRPPTFKPQPLPDRVFDIMQLETKAPVNTDHNFIKDSKVGFANRQPPQTAIRDQHIVTVQKPHIEFVSNIRLNGTSNQ